MLPSLIAVALAACDGDDHEDRDDLVGESDTDESEGDGSSEDGSTTFLDGGDDLMDFGEESSTGEPTGCAVHDDADACNAELGCIAVFGHAIVPDGREWCTELEAEYIGCAEGGNLCPGFTKTVCAGDEAWQTDECVPANLVGCDGPGEVKGSCESGFGKI